jgi:hypothetical protein
MRITLEPTEPLLETDKPETRNAVVTITMPFDDMDIDQIIENLIKPALLAYGFHHDTVDKAFL